MRFEECACRLVLDEEVACGVDDEFVGLSFFFRKKKNRTDVELSTRNNAESMLTARSKDTHDTIDSSTYIYIYIYIWEGRKEGRSIVTRQELIKDKTYKIEHLILSTSFGTHRT